MWPRQPLLSVPLFIHPNQRVILERYYELSLLPNHVECQVWV